MSRRKTSNPGPARPESFPDCLRHFLTPAVFRQAHQAAPDPGRADTRWQLHPLLVVVVLSCWAAGDTVEERFAAARATYVARLAPKRRRPGQTVAGFLAALGRLPTGVLRAVAGALRGRLTTVFAPVWGLAGFVPFGCDGTRLACPRSAELERWLSQDDASDAPPQVWLTALVHLRLGLLWSWVVGGPNASERDHLERLLPTLPADALVVTDAGYQGYEMTRTLTAAGVAALMRVSSQTRFYFADGPADPAAWTDGRVYWWPGAAQKAGLPPLPVRLLRVRSSTGRSDVWLASNVLSADRLPLALASRLYRMRWENEGLFRTYKRGLKKVALHSRTLGQVHREVLGSLLALQLLLAQGAWAVAVVGPTRAAMSSPRGVLREIRRELSGSGRPGRGSYVARLRRACRDRQPRRSGKVRRPWPKRKDHKPPKPPKLRELEDRLKHRFRQHLQRQDDDQR